MAAVKGKGQWHPHGFGFQLCHTERPIIVSPFMLAFLKAAAHRCDPGSQMPRAVPKSASLWPREGTAGATAGASAGACYCATFQGTSES